MVERVLSTSKWAKLKEDEEYTHSRDVSTFCLLLDSVSGVFMGSGQLKPSQNQDLEPAQNRLLWVNYYNLDQRSRGRSNSICLAISLLLRSCKDSVLIQLKSSSAHIVDIYWWRKKKHPRTFSFFSAPWARLPISLLWHLDMQAIYLLDQVMALHIFAVLANI